MPANDQPMLETRHLRTWFPITRGLFSRTTGYIKAVDDISLTIPFGQTIGLVGESGCGKTTLGRTLLGLEKATDGQILFEGEDVLAMASNDRAALRRRMQMIFQDPYSSLNPRMTVLDIVTEGIAQHGMLDGRTREEAARELLNEVGLGTQDVYRYPHEFSGGQRQRISVARALSLRPDFIVCDEAVSALDVSVQAQVINLLIDLRERYRLSYLFISHDLSVVRHISEHVAVMYLGRIVEYGPTEKIIGEPQHPYTQALVSAVPVPGAPRGRRMVLGGDVPSPANPPPGCPFHTRCPLAKAVCREAYPADRDVAGRRVACHLYPESPPRAD